MLGLPGLCRNPSFIFYFLKLYGFIDNFVFTFLTASVIFRYFVIVTYDIFFFFFVILHDCVYGDFVCWSTPSSGAVCAVNLASLLLLSNFNMLMSVLVAAFEMVLDNTYVW